VITKLAVGEYERLSREILLALSVIGFVGGVLILCSAAGVKFSTDRSYSAFSQGSISTN
jgi:hypothetical protein